jgi:hypothetical protein
VPLPVPVAPLVTVNQLVLLLTAVQEHPFGVVTLVDVVPAPAAMLRLVGVSATVHPAAACVTVNVCPPIVSVPLRALALVFAAALNATEPVPLPVAPLVTVSQDVLLLTPVHSHPVAVVTVVEPVPPAATIDWLVGDKAYVHPVVGALWRTVKTCVPMLTAPTRELPVFASTV